MNENSPSSSGPVSFSESALSYLLAQVDTMAPEQQVLRIRRVGEQVKLGFAYPDEDEAVFQASGLHYCLLKTQVMALAGLQVHHSPADGVWLQLP